MEFKNSKSVTTIHKNKNEMNKSGYECKSVASPVEKKNKTKNLLSFKIRSNAKTKLYISLIHREIRGLAKF